MRFLSSLFASFIGTLLALGFIVFIGFLFILGMALTSDPTPTVRSGSVLTMELSGPFPERSPDDPFAQLLSGPQPLSLHDTKEALRKAAVDDRITAVYLQFDGVGGSWSTLHDLRGAMLEFKESGKPLIAYGGTDGFSERDYFLATAADEIYTPPASMFYLNGQFIAAQFFSDMLDRIGVEAQVIQAGRYKSAVEPFVREDLSDEAREQLTDYLDATWGAFVDAIAEGRGLSSGTVEALAAGTIFSAQEAFEAGLVDSLAFEKDVRNRLLDLNGQSGSNNDLREVKLRAYTRVPARDAGLPRGDQGRIAVVYADGAIVSGESSFNPNPLFGGQTIGSETFSEAMREAREDDRVDAIVVRINSPGGSATASDVMARTIREAGEIKPVIVSMGNAAASGGYYAAAFADTIVASPLTLTGSIGVFAALFTTQELLEDKMGITSDIIRTTPHADMFSGIRPVSSREMELVATFIDETYHTFLSRVSEGRSMSLEEVDAVAQGRVWTGGQALELGLVDVLGGLDDAVNIAAEKAGLEPGTFHIITLPREKTLFEQIVQAFEARAVSLWKGIRMTPAERNLAESYRFIREAAEFHGKPMARLPFALSVE